jgi:uncharacterized membrane protein
MGTWILALVVGIVLYCAVFIPLNMGATFITGGYDQPHFFDRYYFTVELPMGLVVGSAANVLTAGFLFMGLKMARNERIQIADIFVGFRRFGSLYIASFITTLLMYLGFVLLIIPAMFLVGIFSLVPLIILDRGLGPIEAIRESYVKLKSHGFSLFALLFVLGLINLLGLLLCCVGSLFTMPLIYIVLGLSYNVFFPKASVQYAYQPIGIEPPR